MNYPLLSEYIESIQSAEDNFNELSYLRPVLDDGGQPVMTSGNFAVVFKMKDERSGKLYAVKCFTREQEGREEAYKLIAEELEGVESPYIVPIRFLEKELFVDSKQTDETEFPVLLMDWVEGKTLDKYLRENLDDQYALKMLAYHFSWLAQWLIPQPFAHGDLKPDNIIVREDGSLVLVDYDGMYVPAMRGQKARELGSPDFRHPQRTEDDFDEFIDDFPIASIFFSLNEIKRIPSLLKEYGAKDRLLLSFLDYCDIQNSSVVKYLRLIEEWPDIHLFYLIKTIQDGFFTEVPWKWFSKNKNPELFKNNQQIETLFINFNGATFKMLKVKGGFFYKGAQADNKRQHNYDPDAEIDEGPVRLTYVDDFWVSESLVTMDIWPSFQDNPEGIYPYNMRERSSNDNKFAVYGVSFEDCQCFIDALSQATNVKFDFPTETEWEFAARGGVLSTGYKYSGSNNLNRVANYGKDNDEYSIPLCEVRTKQPNELGIYDMSGGLYEWCKDNYSTDDFIAFNKDIVPKLLEKPTIHVMRGGCITSNAHECRITNRRRDNNFKIAVDKEMGTYYEGGDDDYPSVYWWQVGLRVVAREINEKLIKNHTISSFSDSVTDAELKEAYTDKYGAKYSKNGSKLISVPKEIKTYEIRNGTTVICHEAFFSSQIERVKIPESVLVIGSQAFWGCKYLKEVLIPDSVFKIGLQGFYGCELLSTIELPQSVNYIEEYGFSGCNSLREIAISNISVLERNLLSYCKSLERVTLPNCLTKICSNVFWNCKNLRSITIPKNVTEIEGNPFRGSTITDVTCETSSFVFENGFLLTSDKTELVACLTTKKIVSVPDSIRIIRGYAFSGCKTIEQVFLPEGITDIKDYAFSECPSLSELSIPSSVRTIERGFIAECPILTRLFIHSKKLRINNDSAFYESNSLVQIIVPEEIKDMIVRQFSAYSNIVEGY